MVAQPICGPLGIPVPCRCPGHARRLPPAARRVCRGYFQSVRPSAQSQCLCRPRTRLEEEGLARSFHLLGTSAGGGKKSAGQIGVTQSIGRPRQLAQIHSNLAEKNKRPSSPIAKSQMLPESNSASGDSGGCGFGRPVGRASKKKNKPRLQCNTEMASGWPDRMNQDKLRGLRLTCFTVTSVWRYS
jgi:hypothetical protein